MESAKHASHPFSKDATSVGTTKRRSSRANCECVHLVERTQRPNLGGLSENQQHHKGTLFRLPYQKESTRKPKGRNNKESRKRIAGHQGIHKETQFLGLRHAISRSTQVLAHHGRWDRLCPPDSARSSYQRLKGGVSAGRIR